MSNFKLYRLESKSGLNDIVLMSILKDIGHITPRVDLVKVTVDERVVGYYYMMEGESDSFFVNNKKVDGDIIGVDNDKLFVNYPIGGILDKKESSRFLRTVQNLQNLKKGKLNKLNIQVNKKQIKKNLKKGIF